jgi:hypothetical protein
MHWIIDNKEWVFSGIGVFLLSLIIGFFINKSRNLKSRSVVIQNQKSGKCSTNYQSGHDINIGNKK